MGGDDDRTIGIQEGKCGEMRYIYFVVIQGTNENGKCREEIREPSQLQMVVANKR